MGNDPLVINGSDCKVGRTLWTIYIADYKPLDREIATKSSMTKLDPVHIQGLLLDFESQRYKREWRGCSCHQNALYLAQRVCTEYLIKIQPFISSLFQERRDKVVGNKLHAIMPRIEMRHITRDAQTKILRYYQSSSYRIYEINTFLQNGKLTTYPICNSCAENHELGVKHE